MPLRMIECVCPPQTSMIVHGRVAVRRMLLDQRLGGGRVAELVEVLHAA